MNDRGFDPRDEYSRAAALGTNADDLTENFEHANANVDPEFRAGGLEIVAAVAIARCRWLEQQLAEQERAVRARLFERTGRVENVTPIRKPKKGKTK